MHSFAPERAGARAFSSITHWVLCFRSKRQTPAGPTLTRGCCCAAAGCGNSADTYAAITGGESFPALQGITDFFQYSAEVIAHECAFVRACRRTCVGAGEENAEEDLRKKVMCAQL